MPPRRYSFQREKIYEAVRNTTQHPTAEIVYAQLKEELPHLSLGTVYRNLHQMSAEGRLLELSGPVTRYDANVKPHTHFRCTRCGAVNDLWELPYDSSLDEEAVCDGYVVEGHELMFYGVCPTCNAKQV